MPARSFASPVADSPANSGSVNKGTRIVWQDARRSPYATTMPRSHCGPGVRPPVRTSATLLNDLGRYKEALAEFREAIRLRPGHALAHQGLGVAFLGLKQIDEATAEFREAVPDFGQTIPCPTSSWAWPCAKGRMDEALAEFREAMRLDGDRVARPRSTSASCSCRRVAAMKPSPFAVQVLDLDAANRCRPGEPSRRHADRQPAAVSKPSAPNGKNVSSGNRRSMTPGSATPSSARGSVTTTPTAGPAERSWLEFEGTTDPTVAERTSLRLPLVSD